MLCFMLCLSQHNIFKLPRGRKQLKGQETSATGDVGSEGLHCAPEKELQSHSDVRRAALHQWVHPEQIFLDGRRHVAAGQHSAAQLPGPEKLLRQLLPP